MILVGHDSRLEIKGDLLVFLVKCDLFESLFNDIYLCYWVCLVKIFVKVFMVL